MKLRQLFIIFPLTLLTLPAAASPAFDRYWVEAGLSYNGGSAHIKIADGTRGWRLGYSHIEEHTCFFCNETYMDKVTEEILDPKVDIISVSRLWSYSNRWMNTDAGIGLGLMQGDWSLDCQKTSNADSELFGDHSNYYCNHNEGTMLGIPLNGSISFGKYLGAGINADYFLAQDGQSRLLVTFSLALGKFTR